jgi:hypothetical protein
MATRQRARQEKVTPTEGAPARNGPVNDLLMAVSGFIPGAMATALEAVKGNLLLVELATTREGENACVDEIAEPFKTWRNADLMRVSIRNCVQELCNYRREVREQVLTEAFLRAKELDAKAQQLKAMLPQVQKVLLGLDSRVKALSHVQETIARGGGCINVDFRKEAIELSQEEGKAAVKLLRKDPNLRDLMRAYDLVTQIIEAY